MKVKVSYTTELEEVPEIVCSMLKNTSDELEDIAQSLCALPVLLKRKESYPALMLHLDELRRDMALIDQTLSEVSGMLEGLVQHYSDKQETNEPPLSGEVEDADKPI